MSDTKINKLWSHQEVEKNISLQASIQETFKWFGTDEGFLNDVWSLLKKYKDTKNIQENSIHVTKIDKKYAVELQTIAKYLSEGGSISFIQELYELSLWRQQREKLKKEMWKWPLWHQKIENENIQKNIQIKQELKKYTFLLANIQTALKSIIEQRDENTGLMSQAFDAIWWSYWLETGDDIYQDIFKNQKNRLKRLKTELLKMKEDIHFLNNENIEEYQKILRESQKIEQMELGTISPLKSIKNSILALPESTQLAWNGTKWIIEWSVNGVKTVLTSALDVSIFLLKLSASWYGINSQYKYEVHNQAQIIWNYMQEQKLSWMWNQVVDILGTEMTRILNLPSNEQSKAIWNLSWNVIGYIASLQGTMMVSAKVMEMGGKVARIQSAIEKLNLKWLSQSQRAQKLSVFFQEASQWNNLAKTLEIFLNGPAETLIWASAMKAYLASYELLKSTKAPQTSYEKLAQNIVEKVQNQGENPQNIKDISQTTQTTRKQSVQTKTEFHENVNAKWPLKLDNLRLEDLDSMVDIPRVIEINGEYISIVKASTIWDNKKIFTVRYGITTPNVQYPPFEWVSTLVIHDKKIYSMETSSKFQDGRYEKSRQELLKKLSLSWEVSTENPLTLVEQWKTAKVINGVKKFPDSEIYDIGTNAKWYKVLMVKLKNTSWEQVGQFEMNLYPENGKNVIYIGSMARNEQGGNITKSLEWLMPRLRDILKQFPDKKMPELVYIRAGSDGATGRMIRLPLDKAIDTRVKNPLLKTITLKLLRQIYN